jgi:hypothetical protein
MSNAYMGYPEDIHIQEMPTGEVFKTPAVEPCCRCTSWGLNVNGYCVAGHADDTAILINGKTPIHSHRDTNKYL